MREEIGGKKWNYDRSTESRFYARACQRLCFTRNTRIALINAWLIKNEPNNKAKDRLEAARLCGIMAEGLINRKIKNERHIIRGTKI